MQICCEEVGHVQRRMALRAFAKGNDENGLSAMCIKSKKQ